MSDDKQRSTEAGMTDEPDVEGHRLSTEAGSTEAGMTDEPDVEGHRLSTEAGSTEAG